VAIAVDELRVRHSAWMLLAPVPFLLHGAWSAWRGVFHWENAAICLFFVITALGGARTRRLLVGAYPLGLVGLMYTSMKVVENVGVSPATVHLCDLRAAELALFGITVGGQRMTLHDWWQVHPVPALDFLCAIPYGTFLFAITGCAIWLYFRDYTRMVRFGWCYLALNVAGFLTYHLYPAAPPWYFHAHGCVVDLTVHATEGPNLARVDAWLGVPYFAGMYGRASDVFGAMPSLHAAYALLIVLLAWPTYGVGWRIVSVAFLVLMCFAAVYLDHHWVLDLVAGLLYCAVVVGVSVVAVRLSGWSASSRRRPATCST
jgi:hypothetical protein